MVLDNIYLQCANGNLFRKVSNFICVIYALFYNFDLAVFWESCDKCMNLFRLDINVHNKRLQQNAQDLSKETKLQLA